MTKKDNVVVGNATIEYTISRSRTRKRTVAISVDPGKGVVVLAPLRVSGEEIRQMVRKRADWIIRKQAERSSQPPPREFVSGESLPYLGREALLFVERHSLRRGKIEFDEHTFCLTLPDHLDGDDRRAVAEKTVIAWYKAQALQHLSRRVNYWAGVAGYAPSRVLVRDQRRRWGSCAADGTLRFNWRLILAPSEIIDYVVVHELAHLRVRNHSADFWSEVSRLMPDCRARRSHLRRLGPSLNI